MLVYRKSLPLAQFLITMVLFITYLPITSQENPWFFPCIKGGAGIFSLFYRRGKNYPFLGGRGELQQQKEEFNE
jgi:hypothetical protein